MANDGRYLYLQLDELALRAAPQAADDVLAGDYWSIIVAAGRSRPYRELAVGPTGACVSREFGADAAAPAASWESGAVVASDTSPPDAWTVSVALPLDKLLRLLVPPGGSVFVNLARRQPGSDDEPVWVPTFGAFDDVTCLRELVLDPPETVPVVLPTADELQQLRKQDLVASWPLDDGAGATVADSSGHSLSGTVLNGASWVEEGGRRALRFEDARRQCVDFGARPEFDLAGPLTLEAWVRYEPTDVWYPAILGKGYEQSGAYSLHIRPGLTLWFEIDDEQGTRHFYNPTDLTLPPGAWAHVAAAYDGSVMRVYINGREAGKGLECQATIRKTIEPLRVGWLGSYGYLNGCVRNAALYSRAMSAQEVFARYLADR